MTPGNVAGLFQHPVGVGMSDPRSGSGTLFAEEEPAVLRAVPKRWREFIAGRVAARQALGNIGGPAPALPAGADRLPVWPDGFTGSISHCEDLCLAVASGHVRALGLDVEPATDLPAELWPEILLPPELSDVTGASNPGVTAKLVFCAKEAAYKAQYPLTRVIYGFHDMRLTLLDDHQFTAEFRIPVGNFRPGDRLVGHYFIDSQHIVAGVEIR
ncbi:4'-phosphopantetheinyl transferase family protein [Thalassovita sp.]|uniref:4'-phosphopantetheinyl transferase family protein n=1 Tax=Thalassovita sp. TaxID=1979401 RepID=UPI0029DE55B4|nr:4'-phosphopantetheinyl transferase superfamily protein [Thalassovita sp.]